MRYHLQGAIAKVFVTELKQTKMQLVTEGIQFPRIYFLGTGKRYINGFHVQLTVNGEYTLRNLLVDGRCRRIITLITSAQ